ncbi:MAG: class I SAM-dependent methyltransferase [Halioglobus sp.]
MFFNNEDSLRRIDELGHRGFIGGDSLEMWYGIGMLQYHFLVCHGLTPKHRFLDIGCGALRLGQYLIPYLEKGRYFGVDAEPVLLEKGLELEIPSELLRIREPTLCANHIFDFSFAEYFDYAIAQSVFTHLTSEDIQACLVNLRSVSQKTSRFYFTFFEGDSGQNEHAVSHANLCWHYSKSEIENIGRESGWTINYLGDWGHPRNQVMALATPK